MKHCSSLTEELENDLYAWLDDIEQIHKEGDIDEINDIVTIIYEQLPEFVLGWTVEELCSAIRRWSG